MTTTTTLVHRPYNGPLEWWREGLVYEVGSTHLGRVELDASHGLIDHVLSLGLGSVVLRPSLLDAVNDVDALRSFIDEAHAKGLRVLVRVSGAQDPVTGARALEHHPITAGNEAEGEGILERSETFLATGADGVDLGFIVPPDVARETDLDRLSEYFAVLQGLVAEYVDDGIIGADVSADYPDALRHHLQDDWLHHLRDDSLMLSRWDRESLTRHISRSLEEHDRFGAVPVWRYLPEYHLDDEHDPGDGRRWFETDADERLRRALALQALVLALPGSVYLRQGDEVGLLDTDKPDSPTELAQAVNTLAHSQGSEFGSPLATVRHATLQRREHALSTGPLAFVEGMEWCPRGALTLLTRDVLVLVNTTDAPVALPEGAEIILASRTLEQSEGRLLVPPSTTTWLVAESVR